MEEREQKSIFREKSLDRISSPEELDQYIKVAPFSVWMLIAAITIFLVGVVVWGIIGRISTRVNVVVEVSEGKAVCYIDESYSDVVKEGMPLYLDAEGESTVYVLGAVDTTPEYISDEDSVLVHMLNRTTMDYDEQDQDAWAVKAQLDAELLDGLHEAYVVTEQIAPYKYITN